MGSLALRPGDLLTILKMALSIGFRISVSFPPAIQVGSEEARLRAGLRPPLKLHGRVSRMQLSLRFSSA